MSSNRSAFLGRLHLAVPILPHARWLLEEHRSCIDLHAEQGIGLLAQVFALVELGLPMQLIGREIEIAVAGDRKCVRPQDAWIMGDGSPFAVGLALPDAITLVVAGIDAALVVGFET